MSEVKEARNVLRVPTDMIVADETLRGRHKPPKADAIHAMAHSIAEHGQLQPVIGRKVTKGDDKGKYQLTLGFTRYDAIVWGKANGVLPADFPILLMTTQGNDEESFTKNVVENRHRNQTTPIDDAHNMRRLREDYGKTNAEISRLYDVSQAYVSQLSKLLTLDTKTQNQVADGKLALSAALLLTDADIPASEIPEMLKSCADDEGKVNTGLLKDTLRNFSLDKKENEEDNEIDPSDSSVVVSADDPPVDILSGKPKKAQSKPQETKKKKDDKPTPKYPRSMKQVKEFWNEQAGITDPLAVGDFAKKIVQFLEGSISDKQMENAFDKLTKELQAGE